MRSAAFAAIAVLLVVLTFSDVVDANRDFYKVATA
jgi:hypothetical protein